MRTLRVTRLEERRVLNADAAPVQQLIVSAAAAANDGQADTFHIQQVDHEVHISLNGQEVGRSKLGESESITIRGSSDDDTFIAELHNGVSLADFNVRIDGGDGGQDVLKVVGDQRASLIVHDLNPAGVGHVSIDSSAGNSTLDYQGIETVEDQLTASDRVFRTSDGEQSVSIDDAGAPEDGYSRLVAKFTAAVEADHSTRVDFTNPLESLKVNTSSADAGERDAVEIMGLDGRHAADLYVTGSSHDTLTIAADVDLATGDLLVTTGSIQVNHDVTTRDAVVGLEAKESLSLGSLGSIHNEGGTTTLHAPYIEVAGQIVSRGGNVQIDSGPSGFTLVRGVVDVSQLAGEHRGGSVQILGAMVALDGARIDASGSTGGGAVFVGGDYQGKNPAIRNAVQTWVGPGTVISADAQSKGSGGKVVVWANEITQFYGKISARGGAAGGGGFVEVSGAQSLGYQGSVDLTAPRGQTGTLLLDPATITIIGGSPPLGGNNFSGNVNLIPGSILFAPLLDTAPFVVYESQIEAQSATANIVLEATQSIITAGDFTDDAVTLASNRDLTLRIRNSAADGNGEINLTTSADGNNLLFRTQGTGRITIEGSTAGGATGNIVAGRLQSDTGTIEVTTSRGVITLRGSVVSNGDVEIVTTGDVTVEGTIAAANLLVRVPGDYDNDGLVDAGDYDVWKSTFGSTSDFRADGNSDFRVDAADYTIWRDRLGATGTVTLRDNVTAAGAAGVDVSAAHIVLDGLTIGTGGSGGIRLNGPTVLTADATINTAGGDVTFEQTVDGAPTHSRGLMFAAGTGVVTFDGAVGLAPNGVLGQIMIQSAGRVDVNADFRSLNFAADVGTFDSTGVLINTPAAGGGTGGDILIRTTGTLAAGSLSSSGGNILLDTGVSLSIAAPIIAGTGNVGLIARGDISQTAAGTISAHGLGIRQAGTANGDVLLDRENSVDVIAAANAFSGGMITYRDANALIVDEVAIAGKGVLTFAALGGIATTHGDAFIDVGGSLDINRAIDVGAGNLRLVANGNIRQSIDGTIRANRLGIRQQSSAAGIIELDNDNLVTQLAAFNAFASGTIIFHDVDGVTVGRLDVVTKGVRTFAVTAGVQSNQGNVLIDAEGTLTIAEQIRALNATVRLVAAGDITQTASGVILAGQLGVRQEAAIGNVLLDQGNDIGVFAAFNAAPSGMIIFHDVDEFAVGTVGLAGSESAQFADTDGVMTTAGDTYLDAGGALDLNRPVVAAGREVRLVARGDIRQTAAGFVVAELLGVRQVSSTGGQIELDDGNAVSRFAAENVFSTGAITFRNANQLIVDRAQSVTKGALTFAETIGVKSVAGNIYLDVGGALNLNRRVDAGAGDVRLVALGEIDQSNLGTIATRRLGMRQLAAAGNILLDRGNAVDFFAAENLAPGGMITYHDANDLIVETVVAETKGLLTFAATPYVKTANGDIFLDSGGALTLNAPMNAGTADVRMVGRGNITQSTAGMITADELGVRQLSTAAGEILLDDGNQVTELAAVNLASGGMITYHDVDDLIVETVGTVTKGVLIFADTNGVKTVNGDTYLDSGGSLTLNAPVNAGTADVRLVGRGSITQSPAGIIIADELGVRQQSTTAGDILLVDDNQVTEFAARNFFLTGMVTYHEMDAVTIGLVAAVTKGLSSFDLTEGIITDNGDVLLDVGNRLTNLNGPLVSAAPISTGPGAAATTGDVRLIIRGDLTQTAAITADKLGVRQQNATSGNVLLDRDNRANELAAENAAPGAMITYRDADALSISTVASVTKGLSTFAGTIGVETTNGLSSPPGNDIFIDAGGRLDLLQRVDADSGDVRLIARGDVEQTVDGIINANRLGVRQESATSGNILLDDNNSVIEFAAANLAAGGMVTYHDIDTLTVGTVSGVTKGLRTFATTIGIAANSGDVLIDVGDGMTNPSGPLSINAPIGADTADVRLVGRGNITQTSAGIITADEFGVRQQSTTVGDILLDDNNLVNEFAAENLAPGGMVTYHDVNDLIVETVGTVTKGLLTFAETVGVKTVNGDIFIDAGGQLELRRRVDSGTADVRLVGRGDITQSSIGIITADELGVRQQSTTAGNILLDANNRVTEFAAENLAPTAMNTYHDLDDLIVETVGPVTKGLLTFTETIGVKTVNGDIFLDAGLTLTLNAPVNAGTADVRLVGRGDIVQSPAGIIIADELGVRQQSTTAGEILLDDNNRVTKFAAEKLAPGAMITYHDADNLEVGTVAAVTKGLLTFTVTHGVKTVNGDIFLDAGGTLTLNAPVNAGTADVRLVGRGNISQSPAGIVTADELGVRQQSTTVGDILLDDNNSVNELAAENLAPGAMITYHDVNSLIVETVGAVTKGLLTFAETIGVKTVNGDIFLDAGQAITLNALVDAGAADVWLIARGDITQSPAGIIIADQLGVRQQSTTAGDILLDANKRVTELAAENLAPDGMITYHDQDDLIVGTVGAVTKGLLNFVETIGVKTANGDIFLDAGGALTLNAPVNAGVADVRLITRGDITQSPAGIITADELGVRQLSTAAGEILLDDGNRVTKLAAENLAPAGMTTYHDADNLEVGTVAAVTKGLLTFTVTVGVKTTNGLSTPPGNDIFLDAGGTLTLNAPVNAGTADVRLIARGDISQSPDGVIAADELGVRQQIATAGNILLDDDNRVSTIAALNLSLRGDIIYRDFNSISVGTVGSVTKGVLTFERTDGVVANLGDVTITVPIDVRPNVENIITVVDVPLVTPEIRGNDIKLTAETVALQGPTILAEDFLGTPPDSGQVIFEGDVVLTDSSFVIANTTIESPERGGITFLETLSSDPTNNDLQLTAGKGNILFQAAVGKNASGELKQLGQLTIVTAHDVTAISTIDAASVEQHAGTGTSELNGNVMTSGPFDLTTQTVRLNSISVATGGGRARLNAATVLSGANAILSSGGAITFTKTLNGVAKGVDNLELIAGSGEIEFMGAVGTATLPGQVEQLGTVRFVSAANANARGAFVAKVIDVRAVPGSAVFHGNSTIETLATDVTLNNIGFRGGANTITNTVEFKNYGTVTLGDGPNDIITFESGVRTSGSDTRMTNLFAEIRTKSTLAEFGPTILMGATILDTTNAGASSPPPAPETLIRFDRILNSVSHDTATAGSSLRLIAGNNGSVAFARQIGSTLSTAVGDLTIMSAHDVTAMAPILANSVTQTSGGGLTMLGGSVTVQKAVNINTNEILVMDSTGARVDIKSTDETVILNAAGQFVLSGTNQSRPIDLRNVVIETKKGTISSEVLQASSDGTGAFGALDLSVRDISVPPLQGGEGLGRILVNLSDASATAVTVTVDWREGFPANPAEPQEHPNANARYVKATIQNPSNGATSLDHLFTSTPDGIDAGDDIPIHASVTAFAENSIQLLTDGVSILTSPDGIRLMDGSPNGIQVVIVMSVVSVPGASSLPVAPPVRTVAAPPAVVASFEVAATPLVDAPTFAQATSNIPSTEEERFYELRIVSIDASGSEVEQSTDRINLTDALKSDQAESDDSEDSILPFNPGKLRDLFRRLPDDHYRIYLIEQGAERLMLDFTIQQGRPVELQDELELPPSFDSSRATTPDEVPLDQSAPQPSALPTTPAAEAAEPNLTFVPQAERPSQTAAIEPDRFAQRLGRAALVLHGGVLLIAGRERPGGRELAADRKMEHFGRRRRSLPNRKHQTAS